MQICIKKSLIFALTILIGTQVLLPGPEQDAALFAPDDPDTMDTN